MIRFYTPVYALTLLLSAALLFSVQPMFSKMILPLLGGTPQVWNTAMLFFQLCLLGGYAYAHGTSRFLGVRTQAVLHLVLLGVFAFALPFAIPAGWHPPVDKDPTLWQLSLMAATVGGPFFVLAGSAPMLQRWFSVSGHPNADNPYFLYGASNLGSMTALLAYPVLIEPLLPLPQQADDWAWGYFALAGMTALAGLLIWNSGRGEKAALASGTAEVITWKRRGYWLILSFIPSSLMLGVTTFLTTDIASVPLLWILPLAIYVGTFILVFARRPLLSKKLVTTGFEIFLIIMIAQTILYSATSAPPFPTIALHITMFFFAAMLCHTILAQDRPHATRLTEFYLIMSIGGALGGFFNAIVAPQTFVIPLEYVIILVLAAFIRRAGDPRQSFREAWSAVGAFIRSRSLDALFSLPVIMAAMALAATVFAFGLGSKPVLYACATLVVAGLFLIRDKRWLFALTACFVLTLFPPGFYWGQHGFTKIVHMDRNFFGVIRVVETNKGERTLIHGTTSHGAQALDEKHHLTPLSYYSHKSPINDVFAYWNTKEGPQEIGAVGLGIGVTACFSKKGRHFDFFEIDSDIAAIAQDKRYFTYLSNCGSPYDIIMGDGRLTIQGIPDSHYDVIVLDAFSSDNIPIHLMTEEAFSLYLRKLKPEGTIVVNVSNNYLDLEPVISRVAEKLGVKALGYMTNGGKIEDTELTYNPAHFVALTRSPEAAAWLESRGWSAGMFREGVKSWSDQYSNIISVLGNKTVIRRFMASAERQKAEQDAQEKKQATE